MSVASAISRPLTSQCDGKCGKQWNGDKTFATCWTCPGKPLKFCPQCYPKHFDSPACIESHRRKGLPVEASEPVVIEVPAP